MCACDIREENLSDDIITTIGAMIMTIKAINLGTCGIYTLHNSPTSRPSKFRLPAADFPADHPHRTMGPRHECTMWTTTWKYTENFRSFKKINALKEAVPTWINGQANADIGFGIASHHEKRKATRRGTWDKRYEPALALRRNECVEQSGRGHGHPTWRIPAGCVKLSEVEIWHHCRSECNRMEVS